jgi:hypothetical protein
MIRINAKKMRDGRVAGHINFMFYLYKYGFSGDVFEESRNAFSGPAFIRKAFAKKPKLTITFNLKWAQHYFKRLHT